jgi:hypothetical protein
MKNSVGINTFTSSLRVSILILIAISASTAHAVSAYALVNWDGVLVYQNGNALEDNLFTVDVSRSNSSSYSSDSLSLGGLGSSTPSGGVDVTFSNPGIYHILIPYQLTLDISDSLPADYSYRARAELDLIFNGMWYDGYGYDHPLNAGITTAIESWGEGIFSVYHQCGYDIYVGYCTLIHESRIPISTSELSGYLDISYNTAIIGASRNVLSAHVYGFAESSAILYPPAPVPVPDAAWLFGTGLFSLVGLTRKAKNHSLVKTL